MSKLKQHIREYELNWSRSRVKSDSSSSKHSVYLNSYFGEASAEIQSSLTELLDKPRVTSAELLQRSELEAAEAEHVSRKASVLDKNVDDELHLMKDYTKENSEQLEELLRKAKRVSPLINGVGSAGGHIAREFCSPGPLNGNHGRNGRIVHLDPADIQVTA